MRGGELVEKELVTAIVSGAHWAYGIRLEVEISKAPRQACAHAGIEDMAAVVVVG